jgi:hypothetical protein
MVHRLALLLGGVGAVAVLALAMGAADFLSPNGIAAQSDLTANRDTTLADVGPAPIATRTVVDEVYVEAPLTPEVIKVNKPPRQPAAAASDRPRDEAREDEGRDDERDDGEHEGGEHEQGDQAGHGEGGDD